MTKDDTTKLRAELDSYAKANLITMVIEQQEALWLVAELTETDADFNLILVSDINRIALKALNIKSCPNCRQGQDYEKE